MSVDGVVRTVGEGPIPRPTAGGVLVVVDRQVRGSEAEARRLDSIETAFRKGFGRCTVVSEDFTPTFYQGWVCSNCGTEAVAPEPRLFRYNSPLGACPSCEGTGSIIDLDLSKIVPDGRKSIRAGAIVPWTTPSHRDWTDRLAAISGRIGVDPDRPFSEIPPESVAKIVEGFDGFPGLRGFVAMLEKKIYKLSVRVFLSRWRGYSTCPDCSGKRLRPAGLAVKIAGLDIGDVSRLTIAQARAFLGNLPDEITSRRILAAPSTRLAYLERIGLGYLTLDRPSRTLSGGESRRVGLTSALGSGLVNTLYVLDEPSIGLHPRDVERLVEAMQALRDSGNSVVVVEHEEAVMRAADVLVEIGPGAGESGGSLVYCGPVDGITGVEGSPTGLFLSGKAKSPIPKSRRTADLGWIELHGATGHNLKSVDLRIPLGRIVCITGVSGAGKSTLIGKTLYPALARRIRDEPLPHEPFRDITGYESAGRRPADRPIADRAVGAVEPGDVS